MVFLRDYDLNFDSEKMSVITLCDHLNFEVFTAASSDSLPSIRRYTLEISLTNLLNFFGFPSKDRLILP